MKMVFLLCLMMASASAETHSWTCCKSEGSTVCTNVAGGDCPSDYPYYSRKVT